MQTTPRPIFDISSPYFCQLSKRSSASRRVKLLRRIWRRRSRLGMSIGCIPSLKREAARRSSTIGSGQEWADGSRIRVSLLHTDASQLLRHGLTLRRHHFDRDRNLVVWTHQRPPPLKSHLHRSNPLGFNRMVRRRYPRSGSGSYRVQGVETNRLVCR